MNLTGETCKLCRGRKTMLRTKSAETHICPNCDQYPWMIQPMTEREVMDQNAKASRIVKEAR